MSDQFRLVFSGEVAEGQHQAVVKKRLGAVLKLEGEKLDVLFSGKPVVVKKATDEKNAARYQAAFQKAGARLRVLPVEDESTASDAAQQHDETHTSSAQPATRDTEESASDDLQVMPEGADVLRPEERPTIQPVEVDTDHLKVQGAVFSADDEPLPVDTPNVDHISLAELGSMLGQESTEPVIAEIDADFDLAEVGAVIGEVDRTLPPELIAPDFDLAEAGADMSVGEQADPPPPPDTSHITLKDEEDDETT